MKTTIDIADPLLRQVKRLAASRGTTLKAVIESALRAELAAERQTSAPEPVRTRTFGGRGLQPGLTWGDWHTVSTLIYEGRGG